MEKNDKKVFDIVHCRHVLKFLFDAGYSTSKAIEFIKSVYGTDSVGRTMTYKWFKQFETGNFDLSDKKRSGRPKKLNLEELENSIHQNPKATTRELEITLGCDHSIIHRGLLNLG